MNVKYLLMIALVFVVATVMAALVAKKAKGSAGLYRAKKLMTANELEFFGRLIKALPDHYVFPQVAMSALLESASHDKKKAHSDRLRIAQQRVDYLVCDSKGDIVVVVELDDRTHSKTKDQTRDERLTQAAIRTVRFQSRDKPSVEAIFAAIVPKADPLSSHPMKLGKTA
jgi:hypothetical protein